MVRDLARSLYYLWFKITSFLWISILRVNVFLSRGKLSLGRSLQIAHPVVFQGRGHLSIADHVTLGFHLSGLINSPILLQPRNPEAEIHIGEGTTITNGCEIISCQKISIGKNCLIGPGSVFMDSDFHGLAPDKRYTSGKTLPIVLDDNVWLGSRCLILKGVHIGRDAVIAAGSVVVKSVKDGDVVGGSPAKVIGSVYVEKETCECIN